MAGQGWQLLGIFPSSHSLLPTTMGLKYVRSTPRRRRCFRHQAKSCLGGRWQQSAGIVRIYGCGDKAGRKIKPGLLSSLHTGHSQRRVCAWWGGGLRWWKAITGSKGRPDSDEGPLGIMGAWTRMDTLSGREALSIGKQPAWRMAPSPNGSSGGRIRRAGRWLRFKSLTHQLARQRQQGCGGGCCDRSPGEQCPVRLANSSSGPTEAPASAPEGALSCVGTRQRHAAGRGLPASPRPVLPE